MDEREFKRRTKAVALRVIRLVESLPKSKTAQTTILDFRLPILDFGLRALA